MHGLGSQRRPQRRGRPDCRTVEGTQNPCVGPKAGITFGGQSTYILPVQGKPGKFIFMADIWRPKNAIDGRYLWLPMKWEGDQIILEWKDEWTLDDL